MVVLLAHVTLNGRRLDWNLNLPPLIILSHTFPPLVSNGSPRQVSPLTESQVESEIVALLAHMTLKGHRLDWTLNLPPLTILSHTFPPLVSTGSPRQVSPLARATVYMHLYSVAGPQATGHNYTYLCSILHVHIVISCVCAHGHLTLRGYIEQGWALYQVMKPSLIQI